MAEEFKLNDEQKNLMERFGDNANSLITKYSNMREAFQVTINIIEEKMNSCEDENIEKVKEKVDKLIQQIGCLQEKLGKANYIARGYNAYKNATELLLDMNSLISDAKYEFGKLEGYSSGEIRTYVDCSTLERNYLALKETFLEE